MEERDDQERNGDRNGVRGNHACWGRQEREGMLDDARNHGLPDPSEAQARGGDAKLSARNVPVD